MFISYLPRNRHQCLGFDRLYELVPQESQAITQALTQAEEKEASHLHLHRERHTFATGLGLVTKQLSQGDPERLKFASSFDQRTSELFHNSFLVVDGMRYKTMDSCLAMKLTRHCSVHSF